MAGVACNEVFATGRCDGCFRPVYSKDRTPAAPDDRWKVCVSSCQKYDSSRDMLELFLYARPLEATLIVLTYMGASTVASSNERDLRHGFRLPNTTLQPLKPFEHDVPSSLKDAIARGNSTSSPFGRLFNALSRDHSLPSMSVAVARLPPTPRRLSFATWCPPQNSRTIPSLVCCVVISSRSSLFEEDWSSAESEGYGNHASFVLALDADGTSTYVHRSAISLFAKAGRLSLQQLWRVIKATGLTCFSSSCLSIRLVKLEVCVLLKVSWLFRSHHFTRRRLSLTSTLPHSALDGTTTSLGMNDIWNNSTVLST